MESLLKDFRFGARILARSPGITAAVILALALGIGANSAMFSVADALLLHPLRYSNPATLALIWDRDPQGIRNASAANFLDWRAHTTSFSELAAWAPTSYVLTGLDRPEQAPGATVSANFFRTLGVKPILGRTFLPDEDGVQNPASASHIAIISYRMWQESLGADPNVLGRTIRLNSVPYAIVGVMPPEFQFMSTRHQLWVPISIERQNREYHYLTVVARLKAPRDRAALEMAVLARALEKEYPKSNKGWTIQVDDFQEWLIRRSFRTRLLLLFAAVGLVLLIACTNVASLLLARASARNREIAVRMSVGATRGRLTRQLLTESVLLSMIGGALGLALAWALIRAAPKLVPPNAIPAAAPIELSSLVMLFTLAVSVVTGLLFGIAPAMAATRPDLQETLKDSSRGSTSGRGRQKFRHAMVAAEVAVAVMLLAGAGLMIESLRKLTEVDLGFDPKNVLTLRLFLPAAKYDAAHALAFHRLALEKIAALPGVQSVSLASNLPLASLTMEVPFDLESSPPREQGERPGAGYATISAGYLHTLGIPLKRGRGFTAADNEASPPVAIVNEAFAERYFPREDPVGKRILLNRPILGKHGFEETIHPEIVGVAGNVKLSDLSANPEPVVYVPHPQNLWTSVAWFVVRTSTDPAVLAGPIRREMMSLDREQPIDQVGSMEQTFSSRFAEPRFQTELMGTFAALALVLAVVGIYGANACAVAQRRHEIGVRMALGATPGIVLREMVGQGMRLTAIGIMAGVIGAVALASVLKSVLVGVSATDPATLIAVSAFLSCIAAVACYIPARKATRIDPAIALRQE
ncbi:MAG: permease [Acidobacteria bacterium]|nr:MAG: permease [Acidobacteriota bacterium]